MVYFDNCVIYSSKESKAVDYTSYSDFNVEAELKNADKKSYVIAQCDGGFSLSVNDSGNVEFAVGNTKAVSEDSIFESEHVKIYAVRERNFMLKIYFNGKLQGSAYDEAAIGKGVIMNNISFSDNADNVTVNDYSVSFHDAMK